MAAQITFIGINRISASIGLAVAEKQPDLHRAGIDKAPEVSREAQKIGAVDKVFYNLPAAVEKADIVVLAEPVSMLRETLEVIAPSLKAGVLVLDVTPVTVAVQKWVDELLPSGCSIVSLVPTINPDYLDEPEIGLQAAHADLFDNSLVVIAIPPGSHPDALRLATDFTALLGASPLFSDPLEVDGFLAATQMLPQLAAAALLNATIDEPGWREARKVAGEIYSEVTMPAMYIEDTESIGRSFLSNRENVLRVLDNFIQKTQSLRSRIADEDAQSLHELLEHARLGRQQWWLERTSGEWDRQRKMPAIPSRREMLLGSWFSRGRGRAKEDQ